MRYNILRRTLASMFCLGAFSILAQVTFMREMLVVFFGNELSIGTILASWLIGISLGAFSARFLLGRFSGSPRIQWFLAAILTILAVILPVQVYAVRTVRLLLRVPMGEYAPFGAILVSALVLFFPACYSIGLFFPFACELLWGASNCRAGRAPRVSPVSLVYTLEAMGSMAGGVILTYVLLPMMSPYRIVFVASVLALIGAAIIMPPARSAIVRSVVMVLAICMALAVFLYPEWLRSAENWTIKARWRAFGVLRRPEIAGSPVVRLLHSDNTVYQNLAITESEGQFVLYANGQVIFVFPDPIGYEHSVHFVMAQNPGSKRVLLIGGNPVGDIPELLKYPIHRLVYVELDPGVGRMVRRVMPDQYDKILADPRVEYVPQDAPRFVQTCRDQFDVILINAPEPTTAGMNRFYTLEFYRNIRRILSKRGFMYTAVTSSERLQSEAVNLGASVYRALKEVFPVVLVTAQARNRFFAGGRDAGLTFNRSLLAMRSNSANIRTKFFRPEYFLGTDEITPEKTRYVEDKFLSAKAPLNTNLKPVTYFYNLLLWSRFSGSGIETLLDSMRSVSSRALAKGLVMAGLFCLLAGVIIWGRGGLGLRSPALRGGAWSRLMAGVLLATTGFCAMALEIVLIFVFQGLYGYVYTRMGLIVAMFMLGLVLGAPSGRMMAKGKQWCAWSAMGGLELLLLLFALAVPKLVDMASLPGGTEQLLRWSEIVIYLAVAVVGWAVGAEFPLGNRLFCDAGGTVGTAAAITDASDHMGAAAGCLVVGVILVPVFGIGASCVVLAALKCAGLLCLASAVISMPRFLE